MYFEIWDTAVKLWRKAEKMDRNDLYRGLSVCITYFFQMLSSVEHISMRVFNRDAGLFSDSGSLRLYADKASAGFEDLKVSQKHNGLVMISKLLTFMQFFWVRRYIKKRKFCSMISFLIFVCILFHPKYLKTTFQTLERKCVVDEEGKIFPGWGGGRLKRTIWAVQGEGEGTDLPLRKPTV